MVLHLKREGIDYLGKRISLQSVKFYSTHFTVLQNCQL